MTGSSAGSWVLESAQSGGQGALPLSPADLLPLRIVDDAVTSETLLHGEAPPTAQVWTGEGPQLLVEGADVALEVKAGGERPVAAVSGTAQDEARVSMNALVLLQAPLV